MISEFEDYVESPMFKFDVEDYSDFEIDALSKKIKKDIDSKQISGDIHDIFQFYLKEYDSIKRYYSLTQTLNNLIKMDSYEKFIDKSNFNQEQISRVIDNVKTDINNDQITDENDIILELNNYFKKEYINFNLYNELEQKKKIPYKSNYNLNDDEVNEIFNSTKKDIDNKDIIIDSLDNHLKKKFEEQVDLNRSKSRIKLNKLLNSEIIKKRIGNDGDKLNNKIGKLIDNNKIRDNEITEKYLIDMIKK